MDDLQRLPGASNLDVPTERSDSEPITIPPPAPDDFVLVSSEGDRIPIKKILLIANSAVFRDMLELATSVEDEEQPSCTLTEGTGEIVVFLAALVHGSAVCSPSQWLSLFRMVDKYQVPILLPALRLGAREAEAQSSLVAYCMAALLEDRKFQEETAWRAICGGASYSLPLWKALPPAEQQRLLQYSDRHLALAFRRLQKAATQQHWHGAERCSAKSERERVWEQIILHLLKSPNPIQTFSELDAYRFPYDHPIYSVCSQCRRAFESRLRGISSWWEDDRVNIKLFDK